MLRVEEAVARVLATVPEPVPEGVALENALGRVLLRPLVATRAVPPWDNSAMDGYALRVVDAPGTADSEVELRLNEVVGAGGVATREVTSGTCTAVMTGAPVPPGADAIVMVEQTRRQGDRVWVRGPVGAADHVRRRGEDVRPGDVVLPAGVILNPARIGVAATLGVTELVVGRRPTVAILSTGDELVPPGGELGPGQIFASNEFALVGQVLQAGAIPRRSGIARDNLPSLLEHLEHAAAADVVVSTGGVSVGEFDYVKEAFGHLGARVDFWKVAIKPGKPLAFGLLEVGGRRVPHFGLPGNPVSCMVNFVQFVRPWLLKAMGHAAPYPAYLDARAGEPLRGRPGRLRLDRVRLVRDGAAWLAFSAGEQGSAVLSGMAHAHGLAVIEEDVGTIPMGAPVRVQVLDPSFLDASAPSWRREP